MDKEFHPTLNQACNYLSMLGLKLNHVSKIGHCPEFLVADAFLILYFGQSIKKGDASQFTGVTQYTFSLIDFQWTITETKSLVD